MKKSFKNLLFVGVALLSFTLLNAFVIDNTVPDKPVQHATTKVEVANAQTVDCVILQCGETRSAVLTRTYQVDDCSYFTQARVERIANQQANAWCDRFCCRPADQCVRRCGIVPGSLRWVCVNNTLKIRFEVVVACV